ncbi:MAG: hypothetical protein ACI4JS_03320 [Oscillospiraceae bacterium]
MRIGGYFIVLYPYNVINCPVLFGSDDAAGYDEKDELVDSLSSAMEVRTNCRELAEMFAEFFPDLSVIIDEPDKPQHRRNRKHKKRKHK